FCAWAVPLNVVSLMVYRTRWHRLTLPRLALLYKHRHQIFRAGEQEDIRFFRILVLGQSLIRLAGDGRKRERPTKAEGAIARARVIREGELWTEASTARRRGVG